MAESFVEWTHTPLQIALVYNMFKRLHMLLLIHETIKFKIKKYSAPANSWTLLILQYGDDALEL